ncbi:MAG: hypothetical protein ABSD10_03595 [Candidatus Saccharimonadales bacterium]|jgi:hypothetical protein
MTKTELPYFERQLPIRPEGLVKNYKDAVKEKDRVIKIEDLLRRGTWRGALGRVFLGWGNANRYNNAMAGPDRERSIARSHVNASLDLYKEQAKNEARAKGKNIELLEDMPRRKRKYIEYQHMRNEVRDLLAPLMDEYNKVAAESDPSDHVYFEFSREGNNELSEFHMYTMPFTDSDDGRPSFEGRFIEKWPQNKPHNDHGSFHYANFVLSGLDNWEREEHEFRAAERVVEALKDGTIHFDGVVKQSDLTPKTKEVNQ